MIKQRILGLGVLLWVAATALSACGGSDSATNNTVITDTTPAREESPFASANMVVPTGAASKSFAVSGCTRASDSVAVSSATVVITSGGDMVFSGAVGTSSVAELGRINFTDTSRREVYGSLQASDPGFQVDYYTADNRAMYLSSYDTPGSFESATPSVRYVCNTGPSTATLTLQQPLSQARVVSNIVTGSTGTVALNPIHISVGSYTQTGSIVSWDTGRTGTFARFASFNLDTAQIGQGSSLDPSTHTSVTFTLPPLGSAVTGYYDEALKTNGDKWNSLTYDNIDIRYIRYANPAANSGNGRLFRFYGTAPR